MHAYLKELVEDVSSSEHKFLVFITIVILILVPITVFAVFQSRDFRSLATHQDCFDVSGDFRVNQTDVDIIFNHVTSGGGYISNYDINHDGSVDAIDAALLLQNSGKVCEPSVSFSGSPTTISQGEITILSWTVNYATSVTITPTVGTVGSSSSKGVSPNSSTTYTLRASNQWATTKKNVGITVRGVGSPPDQPSEPPPMFSGEGSSSSNILRTIKFKINTPYLVGNLSAPLIIGGRSKTLKIFGGSKTYDFGVSKDKFRFNNKLTIEIGGRGVLKKRLDITPKKETVTVNVGTLLLGDVNGDNKIADDDKVVVIEAITNRTTKGDVNIDGVSNSLDWSVLLANFGKSDNR